MQSSKFGLEKAIRLGILTMGLLFVGSSGILQASGSFVLTGSMAEPRSNHAAVLLRNGKVLVAGGHPHNINCASTASAEVYDPATGTWSQTGAMNTARYSFSLTLLGTGKVLAVGGAICGGGINNTAELYDPSTGTWEYTGSLTFHRSSHAAIVLTEGSNAGNVLVIAGEDASGFAVNTAELYDPTTAAWTPTGSLVSARMLPQAKVLNDGRVLVAGGQIPNVSALNSAELYDPEVETWSPTGSLSYAREGRHQLTLLTNGDVLVTGGLDFFGSGALAFVERYNPTSGMWDIVAPMSEARGDHTASLLGDGRVLVAGGLDGIFLQSAEVYDSTTDTWIAAGNLNQARGDHTATVLQSGEVLIAAGGIQYALETGAAELYVPNVSGSTTLTSLSDGHVWVGLKNSDDQGTRFDLRIELYRNADLIAAGLARCISGVARNPNNATEVVIAFEPFSPVAVNAGEMILFKVATRIGTNPDGSRPFQRRGTKALFRCCTTAVAVRDTAFTWATQRPLLTFVGFISRASGCASSGDDRVVQGFGGDQLCWRQSLEGNRYVEQNPSMRLE